MWIRGALLITIALFIDFIQLALGWMAFAVGVGLTSITPVGGGIAGAAAGAYACFDTSGSVIQGIVDATKCGFAGAVLGAAVSAFGLPLGTALGFVFDILISLTLGSGLIMLLAFSGMFYPKYIWSSGIFEMMPGFDALPGWTVMVVLCLIKKHGEEGKAGITTTAAKIISATGAASLTNPMSAIRSANTFRHTTNQIKSDIRPANDNQESRPTLNLKSPRMTDIKPYVQKAA
jgi:hypothetical protein